MRILFLITILSIFLIANEIKPTLTIYTYDSFTSPWGPAPKIKQAFEKDNNCTLKFIGISSSIGALRKIQLEGKKTKADILLGLDTSIAEVAKDTNLFIEHTLNITNLNLPIKYEDNIFVPFDYSYFAFVYNENNLKNIPHSFEDLINMPKNFKIVIQDPRSSTAGLGLLLWIKYIYGENASNYWKQLSPYILTITKGWSESYGLFLKGEADMVLSYTTSPAYHIIEENLTNIKASSFKNGHYGQIEVAAILKSSKQKVLAKKFLSFMHTKTFADIIPTSNWVYPVTNISNELKNPFKNLYKPSHMILTNGKIVQQNRKDIINEWLNAIQK